MCTSSTDAERREFTHQACLYRDPREIEPWAARFLDEGLAAAEPALAIVPNERIRAIRDHLGASADQVRFEDMRTLGLNPARIIPALLDWVANHPQPVRILTEPVWPERSALELIEVLRHEALVDLALAGTRGKLLCVFAEHELPGCARGSLERSHQQVGAVDAPFHLRTAMPYVDADLVAAGPPLEPAQEPIEELPVTRDLREMRRKVESSRTASELSSAQRSDFVLAVNEAATNALQYTEPPQSLRLWRRRGSVVGEVVARGRIEDPLVGRRRPDPEAIRGRGLWLVNQLCDLVELRSSRSRTTLRMHMRCG